MPHIGFRFEGYAMALDAPIVGVNEYEKVPKGYLDGGWCRSQHSRHSPNLIGSLPRPHQFVFGTGFATREPIGAF